MTSYASVLLYPTYLLFQALSSKGINVFEEAYFDFDEIPSELNRMLPKLLLNECVVRLDGLFSRNVPKGKGLLLHFAQMMKSCRKTSPLPAVKVCGTTPKHPQSSNAVSAQSSQSNGRKKKPLTLTHSTSRHPTE